MCGPAWKSYLSLQNAECFVLFYNSIIIEKRPNFLLKFIGLARRHKQEDYSVLQIIQEYLKSPY